MCVTVILTLFYIGHFLIYECREKPLKEKQYVTWKVTPTMKIHTRWVTLGISTLDFRFSCCFSDLFSLKDTLLNEFFVKLGNSSKRIERLSLEFVLLSLGKFDVSFSPFFPSKTDANAWLNASACHCCLIQCRLTLALVKIRSESWFLHWGYA